MLPWSKAEQVTPPVLWPPGPLRPPALLCFGDGLCNGSVFTAASLKPFWEQKQTSLFQERASSTNLRAVPPLPGPADVGFVSLPRGVKSTSAAFLGIARVPVGRPGEIISHQSWPGTRERMRAFLNTLFCVGLCGFDSFSWRRGVNLGLPAPGQAP